MAGLAIFLFGPMQASLGSRPVVGFESAKVRALLAYLAVEADRPHSRDELIGLLWPDQPDATARANLRNALSNLRQAIADQSAQPPFLSITRETVQFNGESDYSLDVKRFVGLLAACRQHVHRRLETCRSCAQRLQQAVELYRSDFLAQFMQSGSEAFEEWALIQRERLHHEALDALYHLTQHFEWRDDHIQVLQYARRQLELDPWREEAHRQVMRALALSEQRSAALAQYEMCLRILAEELSAEPAGETTALYEQIKAGAVTSNIQQRPWLTFSTPLIGREAELAEANAIWHKARTGEGQVLLINGEPGIGKTRLLHELMAQERYSNAHVLLGECYAEGNAPYAPIVQALQAALDPSGFQNQKGLAPSIIADLITFMPALRDRFTDMSPNPPLEPQAEQQRRFDSVASFLATLAAHAPVLLVIEDVHWADSAALALLRHIARRSRRARLLIVATYREAALDEAHRFHDWLGDLQREHLATSINLARFDKERTRDLLAAIFKEAITPEFLDGVFNATEGNPFFVTEVCQALIDEGAVYREGAGWQRLSMAQIQIPRSVRLAILRRIDRLPEATQDTLQRAAVLGREFEFDVLQAMSDLDEEGLIDALDTAERAQIIDEVPRPSRAARLSFAFVHTLIPSTLHGELNTVRRQRLHRRAAQVIEQIARAANQVDDAAVQLAQHFTEASEIDKAIEYWLKVGERARELFAYQAAIDYYQQALSLLKDQQDYERAARTLMKLGLLYHTVFDFARSQQAYDEGFQLWRRTSGTAPSVPLPPAPHALRVPWGSPSTLDPALAYDIDSSEVIFQLFSGLVELTPDLDVLPESAQSWEVIEDGRKYIFHLREDLAWNDGIPLTADDFEYAWKRALDPNIGSRTANILHVIKGAAAYHRGHTTNSDEVGVRALDNLMLVVELENPTGYFLHLLTHHITFPVPRHIVEAQGAGWATEGKIVSNGAFQLEAWQPNESLTLTRNRVYHGRSTGNVQRVELLFNLKLARDSFMALRMYETNQIDITWLPLAELEQARFRHAAEYVIAPIAEVNNVQFNLNHVPFNDVRVRQAFVHAIDRVRLVDVVNEGFVSPAIGGFMPPGLPGHSPGIGLTYDPETARRLLAEAGYPNGQGFPAVELFTLRRFGLVRESKYVQAQWQEILGVNITVTLADSLQQFRDRIQKDRPAMVREGWNADYLDANGFLRTFVTAKTPEWHNEEFNHLIESASRVIDQAERVKLYQEADRIFIQEAVVIPLSYGREHFLLKPWIRKFRLSPMNTWIWKDIVIEPH